MDRNLIYFCILSVIVTWTAHAQTTTGSADIQICHNAQSSCKDCLQAHYNCAWCTDNSTAPSARCRSVRSSEECTAGFLEEPKSLVNSTVNENFTVIKNYNPETISNLRIIQLRPQEVDVKLRQGESKKVNVTFRRVVEYPLDLYYVMDLSFSMKDDLKQLQDLGSNLARDIQRVTGNVRLGFGTFVDKVMMPYASTVPELLQNPCLREENASCAPVFGFRHQLPLTNNGEEFRRAVAATSISGNIDSPEGGFDALMQIAVCKSQIKWRDGALRVIVFTTDASSHIAMDGKLAAILDINDMKCHLDKTPDGSYLYSESKLLDYPSVGQLKKVFEENKIQSIFAVTNEVLPLYKDLEKLLDNSFVEALNNDSSNVVSIIQRAYSALRDKVRLILPTVPSYVGLQYRVLCPGRDSFTENELACDNVGIGQEVVFQFELTAQDCPPVANHIDLVNVTSSSINADKATFRISYLSCACDCSQGRVVDSKECSGLGTLECGLCKCNEGFTGQKCQCSGTTSGSDLDAQCTRATSYTSGDVLCNGDGTCQCGSCECKEGYSGDFCECKRTGCVNDCGTSQKQGTCRNCNNNPVCICNSEEGWSRSRIGDCSCHDKKCTAENSTLPCNGKGKCDCDECVCEGQLTGRFCTECKHPNCTGITDGCGGEELRKCAECAYESDRQDKTVATECAPVCSDKNINYKIVESLITCPCPLTESNADLCKDCNAKSLGIHTPQQCLTTHPGVGCDLNYKIFWSTADDKFVVHVQKFNAERDCPPPPDPLLIVLPVVGGIVLLGLIALILWKIFQTIRDKHEYQQFLKDTKETRWSPQENPIFDSPMNRIENPAYIGN